MKKSKLNKGGEQSTTYNANVAGSSYSSRGGGGSGSSSRGGRVLRGVGVGRVTGRTVSKGIGREGAVKQLKQSRFDEKYFQEGVTGRVGARAYLDDSGSRAQIDEIESGSREKLINLKFPNFSTTLRFGMLYTHDEESNIDTVHCSAIGCLSPPVRCKTRCTLHLGEDFSSTAVDLVAHDENNNAEILQPDDSPSATVMRLSESMDVNMNSPSSVEMTSQPHSSSESQAAVVMDSDRSSDGASSDLFNFRPSLNDEFAHIGTQQ